MELIECGAGHCGVTIDGGYVRYFTANYRGGDLTVRGRNGDPDMRFSTEGTTSLTVEGTYFRMFSRGTGGEKEGRIEGWLTNGGFIRLSYGFEPHTGQDSPVRVNIVPGRRPQTPGDTNYDDLVDLADLNNVRNHFGAAGDDVLGDSNQDGLVDLLDMNLIRNNFSRGPSDYFRLSLEDDEVREVTSSVQVPEPSTFALALAGCIAIARWRYRRA